jgi:phosphatidate phosphatase APP1
MTPHRPRPAAALAAVLPLLLTSLPAIAADKPAWIDGFSGWGGPGGGWVYARVHRGKPEPKPKPGATTYKRLKETVEALELEALKDAIVAIRGIPGQVQAKADDNGFLKIRLPAGMKPGIHQVTLAVATPGYQGVRPTTINVQVWDGAPGLAVISDIDDTLTDSAVTHKLKLLLNTLFRSTWELKTFPNAVRTVSLLSGKHASFPVRPLVFVSGSPWALHSRISDFFDRAGFPHGAMVLRRYSQESLNPYDFKLPHLREIFAAFPNKKFILLGDSGEKDPEVYAQMRKERPNQVEGVYIHLVTKEQPGSARFAGMRAFKSWVDVSADATAKGYAAPAASITRATGTR